MASSSARTCRLRCRRSWSGFHRAIRCRMRAASQRAGARSRSRSAPIRADTLVVLLSGGASALMAVPAGALTLEDKRTAVNALLKGGADITALNTIRKHLSAVKGGRLAAAASGPTVCLAISDVVGDDLSVIGSGPTVPDPSTYRDAWNYIERFGVEPLLTQAARDYLRAGLEGAIAETPKAGDPRFERSVTRVIGGRFNAMNGAAETARALGYDVVVERGADCRRRADDGAGCAGSGADARRRQTEAGSRHRQRRDDGQGRRQRKGRPQSGDRACRSRGRWRTSQATSRSAALAPTASTARRMRRARIRIRQRSRARTAVARRRRVSCRQQRVRVLPEDRRPDHHRSLHDQRRRSADSPLSLKGSAFANWNRNQLYSGEMFSREQILKLMRDKVTHPATPRELIEGAQDSTGRTRDISPAAEVARHDRRARADQGRPRRVCPTRWTSSSAAFRCMRPASASSFPTRPAAMRPTCTCRPPTSRRRCTAIACSRASSAGRSRTGSRGASFASSSAAIRRSSAASTSTTRASASSSRSIAAS